MKNTYQAVEQDLAQLAIEAHGGLERWKRFTTLSIHGINGGVLWGAKGKAGVLDDVTVTVDLRNEKASHWPFGSTVSLRTSTGRASRTRTVRYLKDSFNPGRRSGDTLSRLPGAICSSHTSLDARYGRI
jgi:hypothetical protein